MDAENSKSFRISVKKSRKEHNKEKLPGNDNAVEVMEREIWKKLPEDILEAVIARVPIASFFRFRSVCKKWKSFLYSRSFYQQCAQVQQTVPWFYTNTIETRMVATKVAMYDPSSKKWHRPIISSLMKESVLCASAGGLLCFYDMDCQKLFVCNPLTRSFRELPSGSGKLKHSVVVGMIVDAKSSCQDYEILCIRGGGDYEVYSSIKNAWCRYGNMPSVIKLRVSPVLYQTIKSGSINKTLYWMRSKSEELISFNMETGTRKQFRIPSPEHLVVSSSFLAECDGRIMLVGLVMNCLSICVYVWELDRVGLIWKKVDQMPDAWCREFFHGTCARMSCGGNKDLVMMSLISGPMEYQVTYNARNKEWLKVPPQNEEDLVMYDFSFFPSLTAIP